MTWRRRKISGIGGRAWVGFSVIFLTFLDDFKLKSCLFTKSFLDFRKSLKYEKGSENAYFQALIKELSCSRSHIALWVSRAPAKNYKEISIPDLLSKIFFVPKHQNSQHQ